MIKAIFCDVDGTLLNNQGEISPNTIDLIKQLNEKRIQFIISSGRPYYALTPIFNSLGFRVKAICTLGAAFYDENGELLFHYPFNKNAVSNIYALSKKYSHTGFSVFAEKDLYIDIPIIDFVKKNYNLDEIPTTGQAAQWISCSKHCDDLNVYLSSNVEKLEFHFESDLDALLVYNQLAQFCDINYCLAGYKNIEITSKEASKGLMVKQICQLYGYSLDEVITIGDGGNDKSMLDGFKHSVAMGNADPNIKKICHHLTLDNEHDGVALIIKQVLDKKIQ